MCPLYAITIFVGNFDRSVLRSKSQYLTCDKSAIKLTHDLRKLPGVPALAIACDFHFDSLAIKFAAVGS